MLPDSWVEKIFTKLTMIYGVEFANRWRGIEISEAKNEWARTLSGYQQNPGAIAHALANLPEDRPPNVLQFLALCKKSPSVQGVPQIAITPDPEIAKQALESLKTINLPAHTGRLNYEWAYVLKAKDEANPKSITPAIRDMYRAVIKKHPK